MAKVKIVHTVVLRLKEALQGLTPQKASFSIALGAMIGLCPIIGVSSVVCVLSAAWPRVHLPILLVVSYGVTPIQWVLLVPFSMGGRVLFGQPTQVADLSESLFSHPASFLSVTVLGAVVAWVLFSCVVGVGVYFASLKWTSRYIKKEG